ncbi:DUF1540 domain-containing protein [Ruminococcaceae bacterium OttesenSCG-928-L11]|nr:DUF1540 domain-containing protein [Ruminococcaceae bacterium OttesenSCG-928-L11]
MIREFGSVNALSGTASSAGSTDANQGIVCNVTNCYYNRNRQYCTAEQIKVGPTSASCSDDTICATFRPL